MWILRQATTNFGQNFHFDSTLLDLQANSHTRKGTGGALLSEAAIKIV